MIRRSSNTSGPAGCPEADVLSRFVADELDEPQQVVIGRHVDGCESCRDELDKAADSPSFLPTLVGFETEQDSVGEDEFVDRLVRRIQGDIGSFVKRWSSAESDEASGPVLFPGPADDDAPLGRIAEYEVQELIGTGATGHLYKAFDTRLKRVVAIKILRRELAALEDARARFVREAHAAANLQSEFIVGIHEIRTPDDFPPYLVMQFIEGNSLSAYVNGGLNPDAAARSVSQMLAALNVAHGRGIVHRDVKPSNVLVDASTSKLKLVDFGLARLAEQDGQLTSDGVIAGTPAYMSPEQILDPSNVDERTDLYAAGVVLYELLTGERPFRGSVRSLLNDVMHAEPRSIRQLNDRLPRDLETICQKAMSKEVHRRYQTAEEFRADLQRYLRGEPILARPVSGLERLLLWSRRSPIVAGLSAIVCLLLMGGLYGWVSFTLSLTDANEQLGTSVSQLRKTNTDLETARARAVEGEQRARRHAEVADQQLNIAFDMISALIFDVQDELGDSPETQGLRRRLLSRAMAGLERVEESAGGNRIAELSLVMAKSRLADSFRHGGSTDDALEHYREAAALSAKLLEAHPRDEQVLRSVTLVQWNLGDALREADNFRESHACYQQALQAASALFELGHSNSAAPLIAIGGQRLLRSSDEPDALSQCRDIATRLRASLAENSNGPTAVELAVLLTEMGRHDLTNQRQLWEEADQLLRAVDGGTASDENRSRLAESRGLLSLIRANHATESDRLQNLREAVAELSKSNSAAARESLIESHRQLCLTLLKAKQPSHALDEAQTAVELASRFNTRDSVRVRAIMTLITAELANKDRDRAAALLSDVKSILAKSNDTSDLAKERQQFRQLMRVLRIDETSPQEHGNG